MKDLILKIQSKTKEIVIISLIVALGYSVYYVGQLQKQINPTKEVVKADIKPLVAKPLVLKPKVETKEECSPAEAKLVLSNDTILNNMNLFMLDLEVARVVSYDESTSYFTKEPMFGVKYELISGAKQVYLMIYEPITDMKYNEKHYKKYKAKQDTFIKVEAK